MGLSLFASTLPGHQDLSIFNPASPPAEAIRTQFVLVLVISAGIFLLVEGILLYSLWRFRQGKQSAQQAGAAQPAAGTEPPQVYGSLPIEIAWTVFPGLVVFVLILTVIRTEYEVRNDTVPPDAEPLYVTLVGHQWWWEYRYEKYRDQELNFITANELHVPQSVAGTPRPVYLTLLSADVCHSFWVPRLAGKTDLIPGRVNRTWFQSSEPGLYLGQCAEFCGTEHANMLLRVVIDPPEVFDDWLINQSKPARETAPSTARDTFLSQSCINCHRVRRASGISPNGSVGPDLTHLMSRDTIAAGVLLNTRDNLLRWLVDPQVVKPGCLMPAFKLGKDDWNLIVDYLHSLK
jgi:cytochrome c oxidase subunit 2